MGGAFMAVARDPKQTLQGFTLGDLAQYTREGSFGESDSPDFRVFYAGRDNVHGVLKHLLSRCSRVLKMNMFGYDDDELNAIIEQLVLSEHVFVQGTLDKSQSGVSHEKAILDAWKPEMRASFAIGEAATHQISHTKGGTIDGVVAWEGSTNWSNSGEGTGIGLHGQSDAKGFKAQNNTLAVYVNPVEILKFSTELDEEHTTVLRQEKESSSENGRKGGRSQRAAAAAGA